MVVISRQQIIDAIQKAKLILSDKSRHSVGNFAQNDKGDSCYVKNSEACKFCAVGAVLHCLDVSELDSDMAPSYSTVKLTSALHPYYFELTEVFKRSDHAKDVAELQRILDDLLLRVQTTGPSLIELFL